jgi:uncharacterized glyoxalase superfamily protein PhnB
MVNQSIPLSTVIPELAYADVGEAVRWLCDAFGFTVRLTIANHRAQLNVGDGAMVVTELARASADAARTDRAHSVMVRVDDVDRHHDRAAAHGARILRPPTTYPYGERQYTVEDPGGHIWNFTQSVANVRPEEWGGVSGALD